MQKVSVIIPVYNVEKYLSKCLDSVLNQTYENVEIIIVEDCSLDDSRKIVMEYQKNYPNIKVILNPDNRGLSYCRNRGLDEATGELVAFVDSDDIIDKNFLEDIIMGMEIYHTDIGMCEFDSFINHEKETEEIVRFNRLEINEQTLGDMKECCWNKVYKKSLFDEVRFQPGSIFEDFPFTYPILIKAKYISTVPSKLYHHRRNFNGISLSAKKRPNRELLEIYYSVKVLERNYKLVRQDNRFDKVIKEISHIEMLKMACDAACWQTIHFKKKKQIVTMLYNLASKYSCYFKITDNELLKRKLKRDFLLQMRMLIMFLNKKDEETYYLDDNDIMFEVGILIDECTSDKCKVKEK